MTQDRPMIGISLMLGFCLLAPFADAMAKLLGPHLGLGQLVTLRFGIQAAILVPLVLAGRRAWRMDRRTTMLVAMRTGLHIAGIATVFTALLYLPIADAIAIAYVMPFLMLLLGHWLLGEEVGARRLAACAVGFAGTLMVVQPAFEEVGWPALLPLAVAFIFAGYMLVTRQIARHTDPVATQAVAALMALVLLLPVMLLGRGTAIDALHWRAAATATWGLIALMGVAGTGAHLLMTWALRHAPASTLAPMQYLEIPMAALVGWLIFSDLPGPMATLGIVVTMASGLYIILRERAIATPRPAAPAATGPGSPPAP